MTLVRNIDKENLVGMVMNHPVNPRFDYASRTKEEINTIFNNYEYFLQNDTHQFKYLFTITNKYQTKAREILKKNGFLEYKEFYSAHGKTETLVLLYKIQKNKPFNNFIEKPLISSINCSISTERSHIDRYQLVVTSQKTDELAADIENLKQLKFENIAKTPIWFHIPPRALVPPNKSIINKINNI